VRGGERAMLRIVDDALELREDGGACHGGGEQAESEGEREFQSERSHEAPWSRGCDKTGARIAGRRGQAESSIQ
jgi:hypothetical protein